MMIRVEQASKLAEGRGPLIMDGRHEEGKVLQASSECCVRIATAASSAMAAVGRRRFRWNRKHSLKLRLSMEWIRIAASGGTSR